MTLPVLSEHDEEISSTLTGRQSPRSAQDSLETLSSRLEQEKIRPLARQQTDKDLQQSNEGHDGYDSTADNLDGEGSAKTRSMRRPRNALIKGAEMMLRSNSKEREVGQNVVRARSRVVELANATHARLLRSWYISEEEREKMNDNSNRERVQVDLHMCRLRDCSVLQFDVHSFEYLHIDASLNYFHEIPQAMDACGSHLRSLDLSINQIKNPGTLSNFQSLTILRLTRNGIDHLSPDFAKGCVNLRELDLSNNNLSVLPEFPAWENLQTLNLRGNSLTVLRGLAKLARLEVLSLASNHLEDIIELAHVPSLKKLDLSENKLDDLLEVRDIILCLSQLDELKLLNNPIMLERNYRMVIFESPSIKKFDNFKVTRAAREQWKQRKVQGDIDQIVHETSTYYMRWIEKEAMQKQMALDMLRRREEEIEEAFTQYRLSMEAELEECIRYIQDLAENPHEYDTTFLASIDGHKQWHAYLDLADNAHETTFAEEVSHLRTVLERRILAKAESENYVTKLRSLVNERPSVWQDIKRRELNQRLTDEEAEAGERQLLVQARQQALERLESRAKDRNNLLMQAATHAAPGLSQSSRFSEV